MSNSSMVCYTNISPNRTSPRSKPISRITIHCFVGQVSVERGCTTNRFTTYNPVGGASCNYVVATDGKIGMVVEEKDRSWCSSNRDNDMRAITIECASDVTTPYRVNDVAFKSLVDLVEDICRRNGKTKLIWFGDKDLTLAYNPKDNEMVMTVHRWFKNKACPGDYLMSKMAYIADEVTGRLAQPYKPTDTTMIGYHLVQKGETLSKIGKLYNIKWQDIAKKNGIIAPYIIKPGQKLYL